MATINSIVTDSCQSVQKLQHRHGSQNTGREAATQARELEHRQGSQNTGREAGTQAREPEHTYGSRNTRMGAGTHVWELEHMYGSCNTGKEAGTHVWELEHRQGSWNTGTGAGTHVWKLEHWHGFSYAFSLTFVYIILVEGWTLIILGWAAETSRQIVLASGNAHASATSLVLELELVRSGMKWVCSVVVLVTVTTSHSSLA